MWWNYLSILKKLPMKPCKKYTVINIMNSMLMALGLGLNFVRFISRYFCRQCQQWFSWWPGAEQARSNSWTNDDSAHWRLYVLLGHIEFSDVGRFGQGQSKHLYICFIQRFSVSKILDNAHDIKIANQNICTVSATTFVSILIVRLWRLSSPTVMSPWWP